MRRGDTKSLIGAAALFSAGLYFAIHGASYDIGTATRMGPGFFPVALGMIAMVVAGLLVAAGHNRPVALPRIAWRPLFAVLGGIAAFIIGLHRIGLIPAAFLVVLISALGERDSHVPSIIALAACISVGCWLIFSVGLGMPIPAFVAPF